VVINYRKYFAFSYYSQKGQNVTSYCHKTLPGWSHDILGNNWACFTGQKSASIAPKSYFTGLDYAENEVFVQSEDKIQKINSIQNKWTAKYYPQFESKTWREMHLMKGGPKSKIIK
jgi:cathepsin C